MIATIVCVAVIVVLAFFGVKRIIGSAKGKGCCSGGGGGEIKPRKKNLEGEVIARKDIDIDGMSCINCQYKVERKINDIPGVRAHVNYKKNTAHIEMDREVDDETIRKAVEGIGYTVKEIRAAL